MTKYYYKPDRKDAINNEHIKRAIKLAMEYPYCINANEINIWNNEALRRYNKHIISRVIRIGSYLK